LFPGYAVDNIIQKFLFEDSIHMVAYADIVAGFDLHKLTTGSITIENNTISITLPKAIVLHTALTPETKPLVRKLGVLTKGDEQLETELRNKTLEAMTAEALEK
jgi:Protein of unknown function (DUF4230)